MIRADHRVTCASRGAQTECEARNFALLIMLANWLLRRRVKKMQITTAEMLRNRYPALRFVGGAS
jgi:hypothetical protein